jgi:hypothetical protein
MSSLERAQLQVRRQKAFITLRRGCFQAEPPPVSEFFRSLFSRWGDTLQNSDFCQVLLSCQLARRRD